MSLRPILRRTAGLLALLVAMPAAAATITLVPGAGFTDPTPRAPEGGNSGTTLGQQRTILFNAAAAVWAAKLQSTQTIRIQASFPTLPCSSSSGVLGSAGPTSFVVLGNGADARFFPVALAEAIESDDLNDGDAEIEAEFNARIDLNDTGCLGTTRWYYGLSGPAPAGTIALFPTVLHELAHGLGFLPLLCTTPGGCAQTSPATPHGGYFFGIPDIWSEFLRDNAGSNRYWIDMSNAQRVASSTNDPQLVWDGPLLTARLASAGQAGSALNESRLRMYAPSPFESGSSIAHFHEAASPNLLMEPYSDADVFAQTDLTDCLFGDIGWIVDGCVINTAPTLDPSRSPVFISVIEDSGAPVGAVGTPVSALVDFALPAGQVDNVSDPDAGAQLGIAVTAADSANGSWSFSTDNGVSWSALGAVTGTSARLLAADAGTRLHFRPAADFSGTIAAAITLRAWDRSSGVAGTLASTAPNGGSSAFSSATDTASISVTAVNDAPVLDAARTPLFAPIAEDAGAPAGAVGTPVSALVDPRPPAGGLDNVTDPDPGAQTGLAVIAADTTRGSWFYTFDGGTTWQALGGVSGSSARLLPASAGARLYFLPQADFNGTLATALTFRAWDGSTGSAGGSASTTPNGGSSAFSIASDSASLTVTAVNDAPVLDPSRSPVLAPVTQNAGLPGIGDGTLVATLVDFEQPPGQLDNVSDVDADALLGIAVIAADAANGSWRYSTDGGASWTALGSVSDAAARLLAADAGTRVHFRPDAGYVGNATLRFRAWDRSSGGNGGSASTGGGGGSSAFSAQHDDAPVQVTPDLRLFRDGFE